MLYRWFLYEYFSSILSQFVQVNKCITAFAKQLIYILLPFLLAEHRKSIGPIRYWVMRCWHGYLTGVRCKLLMFQLLSLPFRHLFFFKIQNSLPFCYQHTQVFRLFRRKTMTTFKLLLFISILRGNNSKYVCRYCDLLKCCHKMECIICILWKAVHCQKVRYVHLPPGFVKDQSKGWRLQISLIQLFV